MEVSRGGGETLEDDDDDDDGGLFGQKRKREGKGSGGRIKTESEMKNPECPPI